MDLDVQSPKVTAHLQQLTACTIANKFAHASNWNFAGSARCFHESALVVVRHYSANTSLVQVQTDLQYKLYISQKLLQVIG